LAFNLNTAMGSSPFTAVIAAARQGDTTDFAWVAEGARDGVSFISGSHKDLLLISDFQ
jgi:hypothetical protein